MAKPYTAESDELDPEDVVAFVNLLNQRRNAVKKLLIAHNYNPLDQQEKRKKEKTITALQRQITIFDRSIILCKPLFKNMGGKNGKERK